MKRYLWTALVSAALVALLPLVTGAGTVTWGNSGSAWGAPGNWVGGQLPNDVASFPAVTAPAMKVAPDLNGGTFVITNLNINNGGNAGYYTNMWATGGGKLVIKGANAFTGAGAGRTWFSGGISFGQASSANIVDWNDGGVDFKVFGDLSGTGTIRRTSSVNTGTFKYRQPNASFRGNVVMTNIVNGTFGNLYWWFMTNATGSASFGRTSDGSAPGRFIMGADKWFCERTHRIHTLAVFPISSSASDIQVSVANDFTFLKHGSAFSLAHYRTNTVAGNAQLCFSGRATMQGPLQISDDTADLQSGDTDSGYTKWRTTSPGTYRLFAGGIVVTQAVPAQAQIRFNRTGRNLELPGTISDGVGPYENPIILGNSGNDIVVQGTNTQVNGTLIEPPSGTGVPTAGRTVVNSGGARLGLGPVTVLPGGRLKLAGTGGIPAGQKITVQSSPLAMGVAAVAFDDATVPSLVDTSSSGIFGLCMNTTVGGSIETYLASNLPGNGSMFLGTGGDAGGFRGSALKVGAGGVYRLCGGDIDLTLDRSGSTVGVLVGTNRVQIGATALNAGGRVLLADANTFSGKLTVTSPYLNAGNSTALFWGQPAPDSALGSAAGDVDLQGGRLRLYPHVSVTTSVVKASMTYSSLSMMDVRSDTAGRYNALKLSSLTRQHRGMLLAGFMRNKPQGDERIVVTTNPRPAMYNGILDPYYLSYYATDGSSILGDDFATYDSSTDANGELGFGRFTAYATSLPTPGTGTEKVAVALPYTLAANSTVYALKVTGGQSTLTGTGMVITNQSGGVICLPPSWNTTGFTVQPNLVFTKEAVFFADATSGLAHFAGKITAPAGVTKGGAAGVCLDYPTNIVSGLITVNQGELRMYWDRSETDIGGLGDVTNNVYLNGGQLSPYNDSKYNTLSSSRTVTLGPLGGVLCGSGYSAGQTYIRSKITGPGPLFLSAYGEVWDGRMVQIWNPNNDYEGGTVFIAGAVFNVMQYGKVGSGRVWCAPQYMELWLRGNENLVSPGGTYCPLEMAWRNFVYCPSNAPTMGSLSGQGMLVLGDASVNPARATILTVGKDNDTATWYGIISESWNTSRQAMGSVVKDGTGTWTVYGVQEYRGQTTITNGTLRLMGSVAGNLNAGPNTTLSGIGTVNGNITLNGARFAIQLGSTTKPLRATGTLTINPGSRLDVSTVAGFNPGQTDFVAIQAGGAVSGINNLVVTSGYAARVSGTSLLISRPHGTLIEVH